MAVNSAPKPDLAFHPLADVFPLIGGDELRELAEDIKANGLIEPLTLYEGKILDGRNRYVAAKSIGLTLPDDKVKTLPADKDPRAFVISENIQRRHLSAEQKRELLAKLKRTIPAAAIGRSLRRPRSASTSDCRGCHRGQSMTCVEHVPPASAISASRLTSLRPSSITAAVTRRAWPGTYNYSAYPEEVREALDLWSRHVAKIVGEGLRRRLGVAD
jgi:ParB-like nuclease domain